jgi:hypothetical protein
MSYPCIIFKDNVQLPKHKLTVLKNMVNSGKREKKDISLYFRTTEGMFKMGSLSGYQVESFLDLMGLEVVVGYYEEGMLLEGGKLYTLGTVL